MIHEKVSAVIAPGFPSLLTKHKGVASSTNLPGVDCYDIGYSCWKSTVIAVIIES